MFLAASLAVAACGSVPPERPAPLVAAEQDLLAGHEASDGGEYRLAIDSYRAAIARYRSLDHPRGQVFALISAVELRLLLGEPELAAAHVLAARELVDRDGLAGLSPRLRWLDARVHALQGETELALETLEPLLDPLPGPVHLRRGVLITRAQLALDSGGDASAWLERIEAPGEHAGDAMILRGRVHRLRAGQAMFEGDVDAARQWLLSAREAYRAAAHRPGLAATREALAELERNEGSDADARRHLVAAVTMRLWMEDRVHAAANLRRLLQWSDAPDRREQYRQALDMLDQGRWPRWPPPEVGDSR